MREMDEYKKMPQDTETREAEKETFKPCELSEEGFLGEPFVIIEEEEEFDPSAFPRFAPEEIEEDIEILL